MAQLTLALTAPITLADLPPWLDGKVTIADSGCYRATGCSHDPDGYARFSGEGAHRRQRVAGDHFGRHVVVQEGVHERGVGAVLQQPPHQVGEEFAVLADRRVDPACGAGPFAEQRPVQRLAHAVQALKLVAFDATRRFRHAILR